MFDCGHFLSFRVAQQRQTDAFPDQFLVPWMRSALSFPRRRMTTRSAVLVGILLLASLLLSTILPTHGHQSGEEQQHQQHQRQTTDGGVGLGVSVAHPDTQVREDAASCPIVQLAELTVRTLATCVSSSMLFLHFASCLFQTG